MVVMLGEVVIVFVFGDGLFLVVGVVMLVMGIGDVLVD